MDLFLISTFSLLHYFFYWIKIQVDSRKHPKTAPPPSQQLAIKVFSKVYLCHEFHILMFVVMTCPLKKLGVVGALLSPKCFKILFTLFQTYCLIQPIGWSNTNPIKRGICIAQL